MMSGDSNDSTLAPTDDSGAPSRSVLGREATPKRSSARPVPRAWDSGASAEMVPDQLGDYKLVRRIGHGGMGIVFEAQQQSLSKTVAVKILPLGGFAGPNARARFRIESRAMAQLEHPNIVPVFDVGCEHGIEFFVMQYVNGHDVARLLTDLRTLEHQTLHPGTIDNHNASTADDHSGTDSEFVLNVPGKDGSASMFRVEEAFTSKRHSKSATANEKYFRAVADMIMRVAEALHHAHELQIVHRDVKPSNLLIDLHGHVWLTDFGLAQVSDHPGVTRDGDMLGTLRYMSPEQAHSRVTVDHRTDIYSLGATFYELLTLRAAITGASRSEMLHRISFLDPPSPIHCHRGIPAELSVIAMKALSKSPDERYQTARAMADDLEAFLDDRPIAAQPPTITQKTKRWLRRHRRAATSFAWGGALAVVGLIVALMVATNALEGQSRATERATAATSTAEAALLISEAERKAAEAALLVNSDPGDAAHLAYAALKKSSNLTTRNVLRNTLNALHEIRTLEFEDRLLTADISPNGVRLATVTVPLKEGSPTSVQVTPRVRIWNVASGELLQQLRATAPIDRLLFSSDNARLLTISNRQSGSKPVVWDALSGQQLWPPASGAFDALDGRLGIKHCVDDSGTKALLLKAGETNTAGILDLVGTRVLHWLHENGPITFLAYANEYAITATGQGKVSIWDDAGKRVSEIHIADNLATGSRIAGRVMNVSDVQYDRHNHCLLVVANRQASIWDLHTEAPLHQQQWAASRAAWVNQGRNFAIFRSFSPFVEVYSRVSGKLVQRIDADRSRVFDVSPNQSWIAVRISRDSVAIVDAREGTVVGQLKGPDAMRAGEFRFVGNEHLLSRTQTSVTWWHRRSGAERELLDLPMCDSTRPLVSFHPDSQSPTIATSSVETLMLQLNDDDQVRMTVAGGQPSTPSAAGYFTTIVNDGGKSAGHLWKLPAAASVDTWRLGSGRWSKLQCSADGRWLLGEINDERAVVRDSLLGKQWEASSWSVGMALHADLPLAVVADRDGKVVFWELETALPHQAFELPRPLHEPLLVSVATDFPPLPPVESNEEQRQFRNPHHAEVIGITGGAVARFTASGEMLWQQSLNPELLDSSYALRHNRELRRLVIWSVRRLQTGIEMWVFDSTTGEVLGTRKWRAPVRTARFLPSNDRLLVAGVEGAATWNWHNNTLDWLFPESVDVALPWRDKTIVLTSFSHDHPRRPRPKGMPAVSAPRSRLLILDPNAAATKEVELKSGSAWNVRSVDADSILVEAHRFGWSRFHVTSNTPAATRQRHAAPLCELLISNAPRRTIAASWDGGISVFDSQDRLQNYFLTRADSPLLCADVHDNLLASGSVDGHLSLWSLEGKHLDDFAPSLDSVVALNFNADGDWLACLDKQHRLRLIRISDSNFGPVASTVAQATLMRLAPRGKRMAAVTYTERPDDARTLLLFSAPDVKPSTKTFGSSILNAAFHPSGQSVAVVLQSGVVIVDATTGKVVGTMDTARADHAIYSPDGKQLLTNGWTTAATLWNANTTKRQLNFASSQSIVLNETFLFVKQPVVFSPDGRVMIAMVDDRRVRRWPLDLKSFARRRLPKLVIDRDGRARLSSTSDVQTAN